MLRGADDGSAEQIDEYDEYSGDGIAAHELAGAVHRTVEVRLLAHLLPAHDGLGLSDDARIQIGIDRHLPARHGIQGEPGADFRDAAGALGDDDEVDDHEHGEHHHADGVVAADDELAERRDDVARGMGAGMALDEHDARRGDVQAEAQQRRAEKNRRKGRKFQRAPHVDHGQQDDERQRDVEGEEHVQKERRQRQHHHGEHHHHQHRHAQAVAREFAHRR